ncbi:Or22c [Drosophila busckii]|uniref:Odorant receptor n=1 Tax=Drosophila busckii TaxID=30019 RepID=A0A0M4EC58_DROBS|nr:Or22c [Drosophila busckii]
MAMINVARPPPPIAGSFYSISRFSGLPVGIWPQRQRGCGKQLLCVFSFLVILMGAVGEILYGVLNLSNLVSALEAFCPGCTKAVCVLKLCHFFWSQPHWYALKQRVRQQLWSSQDAAAQRILQRSSRAAHRFSLLLFVSGMTTNTFFNALPLIKALYRYIYGLEGQVELPFNIILPGFATQPRWFPLTYLLLFASGACTVFTFSCVDGFFLCSCMYISGVFNVIQQDIRETFLPLIKVDRATGGMNFVVQQRLADIVERHNAIIDLCTDLTRQITVIVLMHFLSAAFVLCSTILDIMLNSSSLSGLTYISYSVAAMTQLFLYCYGGNHVSESILSTTGSYITLLKTFL